jgi:23S rRNA (adenine2030-N6)-methyltransferase
LNYRHIYHAGNFADIVKHLCLIGIINQLKLKDKPFCVLDAFAGIGLYNLNDARSAVTGEAEAGIKQLFKYKGKLPSLVEQYVKLIQQYNDEEIALYPGSPAIIADLLREHDRLVASELHPEDFTELKQNLSNEANVKLHNIDAYSSIKAFTPPLEGRGLVFLDPPFEKIDEFEKLTSAAKLLHKRFLAGILLIWFPIKDNSKIKAFYNDYLAVGYKESLLIEFSVNKLAASLEDRNKLYRTGLIIANPPWKLKENLEASLKFLKEKIFGKANFSITELNN